VVHEHDVVVVGAGPGGSAAAHYLSRLGLDVLLLDRSDFPRDKTCGDGLTPRALRVLDDMGILPDVRQRGCEVGGYTVVAPNGRHTAADIPPPGALVVPRLQLDHLILQRAISSGARFEPNVAVSHLEPTPHGVTIHADAPRASSTPQPVAFRAKTAVLATGAAFGVLTRSRILPQQPRAMLAARAYFRDLQIDVARTFELRFTDIPMPGYGWVFPVAAREANIGVGFLPGKRTGTAHQAMARFSAGQHMQGLLAGARQDGPLKGYPIRVDFLRSPTTAPRTLLVGEATGLVNPLTGEGIDYALESGRIAAEHLARAFASDRPLDEFAYDRDLRARFGPIFRFSEIVRDWYCHPLLLNALVPLANAHPELRQLLARTVLGERQPAGYGPANMLARLAVYLVRTRTRSFRHPHD
jgi:geranylgeranyl reductase family protein